MTEDKRTPPPPDPEGSSPSSGAPTEGQPAKKPKRVRSGMGRTTMPPDPRR